MNYTFKTFLSEAPEPEFPAFLHDRIMRRVRIAAVRRARIGAVAFFAAAFGSAVSLVAAFGYIMQLLSSSGFFQYFSLVFSDGNTVLSLWQEFIVLLSETFPFAQAAIFFTLVIACLMSLRAAFRFMPLAWSRPLAASS